MAGILDEIEKESMRAEPLPKFEIGDTVTIQVRILEGEKERQQAFTGTVIARDGGGAGETFTLRRVSHGTGVERVFPIHSPNLASLEVVSSAKVRRAKLYYLRKRVGKRTRLKERIRRS
ncbi:MAG: 50S ribosomal protein L19 [Verrucomicrobia bacterium]|nr:50S ribosomal protein L19 [Verrucomicrobiota bacterium]